MEELIAILNDLHPEVDFATEKNLVVGGILDSFDIVSLISEINEEFDVTISAAELTPENFDSAESIYALIKEKLDDED
ncbi:MAG: acyl carrier protein [Pseudobutyrivibrio sp.]|nr:acyl carrier protein [Pseudobutyrivibrio sp.]